MKRILSILSVFAIMATMTCCFISCDKDRNNDPESGYNKGGDNEGEDNGGDDEGGDNGGKTNTDIVETLGISNISSSSATFKGRINSNVNGELYKYGFIYSSSSHWLDVDGQYDPQYSSTGYFLDNKVGEYTYTANDLQAGTNYYVRAFAQTPSQTYYGNILQFSTQGGDYYIKHPWGGGAWTWNKMSKSGLVYTYTGLFGGYSGANINTTPNDEGAMWFPWEDIEGGNLIQGVGNFNVTFTYNPDTQNLSVSQ